MSYVEKPYGFHSFAAASQHEQSWVGRLGLIGNKLKQLLLEGDDLDVYEALNYLENLKLSNGLASITPQASQLLAGLTAKVNELAVKQGIELTPKRGIYPRPGM